MFLYGELTLAAKHRNLKGYESMSKNEIKYKWSVSVSSKHIGKYAWMQPTLNPLVWYDKLFSN